MVSVVIPVYNVDLYLDRCLETVINQTYREIEILLINDGSTDGSADICKKWSARDSRILYHEKANEGLGPTRNFGIKKATGEYILFIDSDDWWELNTIEKLTNCAKQYDADIVFMNFYYSEFDEQGILIERPHFRWYSIEGAQSGAELPDVIFDGDARMWSKLFRRSLFIDNGLYMPAHPYEDFPIMPLLVIYAKCVCQIDDLLYHYYYVRPNNLIGNPENKKFVFTGLRELYDAFRERGLSERFDEPLRQYIINMAKFALNEMTGDKSVYIDSVMQMYPDYPYNIEQKIIVWGSYSSLVVARNVFFLNSQIAEHYMFSSIISAMSEYRLDGLVLTHENAFRQDMICKDVRKEFVNHAQLYLADYIFVDFLEEISDIVEIDGSYYTNSEAHSEIGFFTDIHDAIPITAPERRQLWQKECLVFIAHLKKNALANQIVLLRMKLCTKHGTRPDTVLDFLNTGALHRVNAELDEYYDFFEANFPGIKSIVIKEDELSFTYEYTKYGCLPQYYNGMKYKQIADQISAHLGGTQVCTARPN